MDKELFFPPVAIIIVSTAVLLVSFIFSKCAFKKNEKSESSKRAYSCGEDFNEHLIQPDYSQFFPFAFFFTILHVVALVIATVPVETIETLAMAAVYIIGAGMGLFILLRR